METMNLEEAIELLEINDLHSLDESDLKLIRNRAKRRWHFDKIIHTNPSESEIKRYNENTYKVDIAVEVIKSYLKGEIHVGKKANDQVDTEDPIDIIKRNAENMKDELSKKWEAIKSSSYKEVTETILVSDGVTVKEALKVDREDQVFNKCTISFVGGWIFALIIALPLSLAFPPTERVLILFLNAFAIICLVGALPLSRIWLPNILYKIIYSTIDLGIWCYNILNNILMFLTFNRDKAGLSALFLLLLNIPLFIAKIISFIIISPLYIIAGELLKERKIGEVHEKVNYYAGLAEWYIDDLLEKDIQGMSDDELFSLSHAYNELTTL